MYQRVRRKSRTIPFGYKVDPDDPKFLLPIPEELDTLAEAAEYLSKNYSQSEIARWVIARTGRYISLPGLLKRVKKDKRAIKRCAASEATPQEYEESGSEEA